MIKNVSLNFSRLIIFTLLFKTICTGYVFAEVSSPLKPVESKLTSIFEHSAETINLTETLILISKDWNPTLDEKLLRKEISQLVVLVKNKLKPENTALETVNLLRQVIHHEKGYRYTEQVDERGIPKNDDELFLHGMLKSKLGYCMNLSLLYLMIGDQLGLPLYGVALPNHFFVRYDSGNDRINIETTELGTSYPDSFYENRFGVQFDSKTPFFTHSLNKKKSLGAYLSNVGMVYHKNARPHKSIFYLKPSTKINPLSIEAHNNLANIYGEIKQPELAISQYKKALEANPNSTPTFFNLAQTYTELSKTDLAIESLLQVIQIEPSFNQARRQLVKIYLQKKNFISALLHLKKLTTTNANDINAHISMAKIYNRLGNFKLAINVVNPIISRNSDNIQAREILAEIFYNTGDLDHSIAEHRRILEKNSDYLPSYIQLGWIYYRKGEFQMATAWTKRGLKLGTRSPQLDSLSSMNLGLYSWLNNDYVAAKKWYRKAMKGGSKNTLDGILEDLKDTALLFPKKIAVDFFSGWIYMETGKKKMALPHLTQFLNHATENELSKEARSMLGQKIPLADENTTNSNNNLSLEKHPPKNMVFVSSGFFIMGSNDHGEDEAPEHKTYLDSYYIDRYEVSANDFSLFLNDVNNRNGYYLNNQYGTLFYNGKFQARKGFENHPINNVKWKGAFEYCRWKGKHLPTEAQWEKAARGEDGKIYPWGNKPPAHNLARYRQVWTKEIKHHVMVPVNLFSEGTSPYGAHHMAGNVKEWVDDWFDREYYDEPENHINPKGQIGGEYKVLRGGSWRDLTGFIYSSFRNNAYPYSRLDDYGFRCAKNIETKSDTKQLTKRPFHKPPQIRYASYQTRIDIKN
ncbi:MAG: SUMF1/EgtB/PvdO family nonheme iron enzyme [Nitrospinaceae bacterium]|nr:SUMF1/EgtB/PvdO family nonheme iron enzyme [Nitrospinaceae bacterium]